MGFQFVRRTAEQKKSELVRRRLADTALAFKREFMEEMSRPDDGDERRLENEIRRTGSVRVIRVF